MLTVREEQQLADVVARVRDVLGPATLGRLPVRVGGPRRASSPRAISTCSRRHRGLTSRDEKRRLAYGLWRCRMRPSRRTCWLAAPVRGGSSSRCSSRSEVRPWPVGRMPRFDFQYGELAPRRVRGRERRALADGEPRLGALVTMTLLHGRALVGPPAAVPPGARCLATELSRLMLADLPSMLADLATDTRNVLLTLVRIWATVATGEIRSKDGAADWAIVRWPVELCEPLAHARAAYLGDADDEWDRPARACTRRRRGWSTRSCGSPDHPVEARALTRSRARVLGSLDRGVTHGPARPACPAGRAGRPSSGAGPRWRSWARPRGKPARQP